MATRKPLVQIAGQVQEIPAGDEIISLKTINGESLTGTGNIVVSGGGGTTNYLNDYGLITDTITTTTDYGALV